MQTKGTEPGYLIPLDKVVGGGNSWETTRDSWETSRDSWETARGGVDRGQGMWVKGVGGDDGEHRPWHNISVSSIESRLMMWGMQARVRTVSGWPRLGRVHKSLM